MPEFRLYSQTTSAGYHKSRNTRVYLCAASADVAGSEALDWTMESLVQDGDELIVVRGFDVDDLCMFLSIYALIIPKC